MDRTVLMFVAAGVLLVLMALSATLVKRLPLSTAMLYVAAGALIGGHGIGLFDIDFVKDAHLLERITEVAVIVSLFTAGMKLRLPFGDDRWRIAMRLASVSMLVTIGVLTLAALALGLPMGAAVLLAAILAPTDPVLASDVQVSHAADRDRVRFSLTGEAGFNDGAAFPFVMLGLGLLGAHELGSLGLRWLLVDVAWAIPAGIAVGAILGTLVGRLVLYLRRSHREGIGLDDFLALGLIALSYGLGQLIESYGFLAVFAAGVALRRVERKSQDGSSGEYAHAPSALADADVRNEAATGRTAPSFMAQAVLSFNEQIERIGEVLVVVLLGGMITLDLVSLEAGVMVVVTLLVARPLSVLVGLLGSKVSRGQRRLIGWFGVRGVGSLYYLAFAVTHGLPAELAAELGHIVLAVVAVSIVVHGISVTPLMNRYVRRRSDELQTRERRDLQRMPSSSSS